VTHINKTDYTVQYISAQKVQSAFPAFILCTSNWIHYST